MADIRESYCDTVYANGELIRADVTATFPEGRRRLFILKEHFPEIDIEGIHKYSLIGINKAYRPPYKNRSLSLYYYNTPDKKLLNRYGVTKGMYKEILSWYALKYNLVTKEILFKIVISYDSLKNIKKPRLPKGGSYFFARIHHPDKTVDPHVDFYLHTTPEVMKDYCKEMGVTYPLGDRDPSDIFIWGVAFNSETLEVVTVKAYGKTTTNDATDDKGYR